MTAWSWWPSTTYAALLDLVTAVLAVGSEP
jgi:hypothetical protein